MGTDSVVDTILAWNSDMLKITVKLADFTWPYTNPEGFPPRGTSGILLIVYSHPPDCLVFSMGSNLTQVEPDSKLSSSFLGFLTLLLVVPYWETRGLETRRLV